MGMTGGIASGKSTVASILKQNGIPVIDADELSHALTGPGGKAISQILSAFGPGVLDHPESRELASLNRTQMRGLIFKNPLLRKKLEAILHPLIQEEGRKEAKRLFELGNSLVIYDAALLVETGTYKNYAGLIVVSCPWNIQIERLMKRNAYSKEEAKAALAAQMPLEEKIKVADWVIENDGGLELLKERSLETLKQIRAAFFNSNP